ncbi:laminin subunit alpha-2-like [Lytechinus pictus]|uniref:laminin subunit alpha-2-like n=1 Tax=Lytechinus pictus TaxID=7653 RepID=UPI0030B9F1B6
MHLRFGKMEFVLLLCAAVTLCSGLSPPVEGQQGDDANAFNPRGLFPHIFNLATRGRISVNATCGDRGPETYCKLVEHVPNESEDYPQCRVCNSRSFSKADRHPIWNAIDGTESWWQSPSIANGMQYHWVTITLDLGQVQCLECEVTAPDVT